MTIDSWSKLVLSIGLFYIAAMPVSSEGVGFSGVGGAPCDAGTQNITGTFTSKAAHYFTKGTCTTKGSLGAPITFPYKAEGRFSDNVAVEAIEVTAAPINQPFHPYGKWTTTYSCPVDPWLAPDPFPASVTEPVVKCQTISRNDFSPTWGPLKDGKRDKPLDRLFDAWRQYKPVTSYYLAPPQRQALAAKRENDLRAEAEALAKAEAARRRETQRLKGATQQPAPYRAAIAPIIHSPAGGQRFLNQTPVPIKITPPPQWADTNIDINGAPVKTAQSVTGYMVRIERKDPAGNWVTKTTLPVGAAEAESPSGYMGFGNGAPPGGITTPGVLRVSAMVSAPRQSGWSDWVEFVVMAPVQQDPQKPASPKLTQPPTRAFGK